MKKILFTIILMLATAAQAQTTAKYHVRNNTERGSGVIITNADGDMIGYTDRGTVDDAMKSEVFRKILKNVEHVNLPASQKVGTARRAPFRRASVLGQSTYKPTVGPLLQNLWSQYEAPYDWLAPIVDGERCDAGCVALAMAQVMHYWQWPEHGYGSYTYNDTIGCNQTLTADFESHYYDWPNMLGNYEGVDYTEAQGYAVAQLLYDCGVAVDMEYTPDGSGAFVVRQPMAMSKFFGYDSSCQMHYRDFYTLDEWTTMFYEELNAGRPILMSGESNKYNHAFVCDGYDERGFFHFSFGNVNGAADGFFYLPYLTPDIRPEMDPDEGEGGFNIIQTMTTHIMPVVHPDATGVENHLMALSGIDAMGNNKCVVRNLCNIGWNMLNDSVALALVRNGEIVDFPYVYEREFLLEEVDDTTYTDTLEIKQTKDVEAGICKLVPMYRDSGGEWKEARTTIGTPNYLIADVTDEGVSLRNDKDASGYLTLDAFSFPEWISSKFNAPDYTLRLTCHDADICGRVYVMLENATDDTQPPITMQCQGLTIAAGETVDLRYYHTYCVLPEGTYNLRICYDHDLFNMEPVPFDNVQQTVVVSTNRPDAIAETTIDNNSQPSGTYSLSGVRMPDGALPKGVYVKDGKKVAVIDR